MTRDPRLTGRAFDALVDILSQALLEDWRIDAIITKLDVQPDVPQKGDADAKWTSVLGVAAQQPEVLDELLALIDRHLKKTLSYPDFLRWRGLSGQGGHVVLDQAVSDVRKARTSLLAVSDPRKGLLPLRVMRSSIMEIKEAIEAMTETMPRDPLVLAAGAEELAAAKSEILFACEYTLREVDQLMVDIEAAREQSARVRQELGGQEAFAADRSMVRHLLQDRGLVDIESQALLQVLDEQLAHMGIALPGRGPTEPQQRAEHEQ